MNSFQELLINDPLQGNIQLFSIVFGFWLVIISITTLWGDDEPFSKKLIIGFFLSLIFVGLTYEVQLFTPRILGEKVTYGFYNHSIGTKDKDFVLITEINTVEEKGKLVTKTTETKIDCKKEYPLLKNSECWEKAVSITK
jgi:hypothetical protein